MLPTSAAEVHTERDQTDEREMGVTLYHFITGAVWDIANQTPGDELSAESLAKITRHRELVDDLDSLFSRALETPGTEGSDSTSAQLLETMYVQCLGALQVHLYLEDLPKELVALLKGIKEWHIKDIDLEKMQALIRHYVDTNSKHPLASYINTLEITPCSPPMSNATDLSISTNTKPQRYNIDCHFASPRRRKMIDITPYTQILKNGLKLIVEHEVASFLMIKQKEIRDFNQVCHLLTAAVEHLGDDKPVSDTELDNYCKKEVEDLVKFIDEQIDIFFSMARQPSTLLTPFFQARSTAALSPAADSTDIAGLVADDSMHLPLVREGRHALLLSPLASPHPATPEIYQYNLKQLKDLIMVAITGYLDEAANARDTAYQQYIAAMSHTTGHLENPSSAESTDPSNIAAMVEQQFDALKIYISVAPRGTPAAGAGAGGPTP